MKSNILKALPNRLETPVAYACMYTTGILGPNLAEKMLPLLTDEDKQKLAARLRELVESVPDNE